ncbi:MAG: Gfo/Idh/MocA family oxidoreductase [Pirellulaceae bacterium]|nr:Gfo/Idh/MocA family oxidoreductase [Pirellulaceae bacterium]
MTHLPRTLSRRNFVLSTAATGAVLATARPAAAALANDEINIGMIGCGGRAGEHMGVFGKMPGVKIVGLCDPDEKRTADAKKRFPDATTYTDLRALLDNKSINAVVIATCNHWHCLAAIWAMQAGKDVYVEKPLSHSQWEGQQTIAAARKYKRVCQVGTQQRSDPMQAEIKKFLHEDQALGKLLTARVNRYGVRAPIGKLDKPLEIDSRVAYDLWLGPAQKRPIYREKLQYDWHWDWNTGSGEMGNWGVHVLDDLRNNVFLDKVTLPQRIFGGGGRVAWNDAGETPNVHFVYFDTGSIPVVIGLSNLPAAPKANNSPAHPGPGSGYVVYCEGGRFEGQRGRGVAFDAAGKEIRKFSGNSGGRLHQENFIACVREGNPAKLNTDVEVGHHSTGWCNLANIAYQTGSAYSVEAASQVKDEIWHSLLTEMQQHLKAYGVELASSQIKLSPMLSIDVKQEKFVGPHAEAANQLLKREYRAPYVVPETV